MTPQSLFEIKKGRDERTKTSFLEYYVEKYNTKIKDKTQPLLKHIDKKNPSFTIYLVPELCTLTGLNEKMISDFHLMRNISKTTKPEPQQRLDDAKDFLKSFESNPEMSRLVKDWGFFISTKPEEVLAKKLDPGKIFNNKYII